jgi:tetratricopeptide (TPR) repeat protein
MGKSTLAARFLQRRQAAAARVWALVLDEPLPAAALEEEMLRQVEVERPAVADETEATRQLEAVLKTRLREAPGFFLLDNFEGQQDEDGRLLDEAVGPLLSRWAQLGGSGFTVLVTSRLAFPEVEGVRNLDLGELPPSAARKLKLLRPGLKELNEEQWEAVLENLGGHPKALEILDGYLQGGAERAAGLLRRFGKARDTVEEGLARERQERGRRLLLEEVLESVPEEIRPAFHRLCLLRAPLPAAELLELLTAEGLSEPEDSLGWLRRRGLLARTVAPSAVEGGEQVHRLLASSREEGLVEKEGLEVAQAWHRRVAEHWVQRPGPLSDLGLAAHHQDAAGDRAGALGLYHRWALQLRDRHAYRACEQVAREGLRSFPPGEETALRVAGASLLLSVHDGLVPLGELGSALDALDEAEGCLAQSKGQAAEYQRGSLELRKGRLAVRRGDLQLATSSFEKARESFRQAEAEKDQAIVTGEVARLRAQAGQIQEALTLHQEQLEVYERLGDVRERAVTLGDIARLRAQAGQIQEALTLYEEMLGIFERLGDVRSRAVTLGDIARLKIEGGETAEARRLYEEILTTYRELGDVDSSANSLYYLANLDLQAGNVEAASARLAESWAINVKLNRADGIAVVGRLYGQVLAAGQRLPEAREVLQRSEAAFRLLGWTDPADQVAEVLGKLQAPEAQEDEDG